MSDITIIKITKQDKKNVLINWIDVKYREIEKLRQVLFTQLLYEYDKKIEIEELLDEVDEWLEEYKPSKVFSFKNIRKEEENKNE